MNSRARVCLPSLILWIALGANRSAAQTFTQTIHVPAGTSTIANNLNNGSQNRISDLFNSTTAPNFPEFTLLLWNCANGTYEAHDAFPDVGFLSGENRSLNPGEGALIQSTAPFTLTLTGTRAGAATPVSLPPGGCCWLSAQTLPGAPPTLTTGSIEDVLGPLGPSAGYQVQKHVPGMPLSPFGPPNFTVFNYAFGVWSPAAPTVNPGESVWVCRLADSEDITPPAMTLRPAQNISGQLNHTYMTVTVAQMVAGVTDARDVALNVEDVVITHATSDEVDDGPGGGNFGNDLIIDSSCKSVQLRRECEPAGDGRVYTVGLKVADASGNTTVGSYRVNILRSGRAVDSGPVQTVMGPCHPGYVAGPQNPFNPSPPIPSLVRPDDEDASLAAQLRHGEDRRKNPRPGHFVDPQSGRFIVEESLLWLRGPRMDLFWAHRYTSGLGQKTALGHGWNHCWNIFLEKGNGTDLQLSDDTGRQSTYSRKKGLYTSPELFTEGQFNPLGEFILKFPQTGLWVFHALDGSPQGGKLKSVINRNGTTTSLIYNEWGQLVRIEGPFHRTLTLAYNSEDLIASVTDSSGRSVRYQYYGPGEARGSEGDLKSVRTPIVVGTPNGNDFPEGKTTTYTYTTGFPNDDRNHQLLTITDPSGQTWLENTWSPTVNRNALTYNRVIQQRVGVAGQKTTFHYAEVTPRANNNQAVLRVIENSPLGHVTERFYTPDKQLVLERQYTGNATPGIATTPTQNRPGNPLRSTDPAYFETQYEWNADARLTRVINPDGSRTLWAYRGDATPKGSPLAAGNLLSRTRRPGPLGAEQVLIKESFKYHPRFNLVTEATDPNGGQILYSYNDQGDVTRIQGPLPDLVHDREYNPYGQLTAHTWPDNGSGHLQRDVLEYFGAADGPEAGYLKTQILDVTGLALTSTYEHNAAGYLVSETNPNGGGTLYSVNALGQVVGETSPPISPHLDTNAVPVRLESYTSFDANNNVVLQQVQNLDGAGVLQPNATLDTAFAYTVLNQLDRVTREVEGISNVVTVTYAYDLEENPTLIRFGNAGDGSDLFNQVQGEYDERGLLFRKTQAPGSLQASTEQIDYTLYGQANRLAKGLEESPRVMEFTYDGFHRPITGTDPMGNVITWHYDSNGNLLSQRIDGERTDVPGSAGNVRLAEAFYTYDAANRLIRKEASFFDPATQLPIGDGLSTTEYFYSPNSKVIRVRDDNGHETTTAYDTANRPSVVTDALGNTTTYARDANGNIVSVTEVDQSDVGSPPETFVTTFVYDGLDRLIQRIDNAGQVTSLAYNTLNNVVLKTDALGVSTRYDHDGLGRLLRTVRDLNGNGPDPFEAADLVISQTWDASSRLTSRTDDNGNTTTYAYDSLDRLTSTIFADSSTKSVTYDVHGNPVTTTDPNGSVTTSTFDLLDRVIARSIARAPGVLGTTAEQLQYDGLSRLIAAENDDSRVTRAYNSLSLLTQESQQSLPGGPVTLVQSAFDGVGNQTALGYPGGRVVLQDFDPLNRLSLLQEDPPGASSLIASYQYFGPRVQQRDYGNGTRFSPGYDTLRRVMRTTHSVVANGTLLDNRQYSWDAVNNVRSADDLLVGESRLYTYDPAQRLVDSQILPGGPSVHYTLDGVGNRLSVAGGSRAGAYSMDATSPAPADFPMNQYTTTPFDSRVYDPNGNLTGSGALELAYNYRNQLVQFTDLNTAQTTRYQYDCLGRRITKEVAGVVTHFSYDDAREIEERDAVGTTLATYVWGSGIDELLEMTRGGQRTFVHSDHQGSVTKLTDAGGNVSEQYNYDDYGEPFIFDGNGTPLAQSAVGNPHLFTGRRHDPETGLYYYRSRHLDPFAGRFLTRDTIGIWGDPGSWGNAYTYVGNNPGSYTDPSGTTLIELLVVIAIIKNSPDDPSAPDVTSRPVSALEGDPIPGLDVKLGKNPGGQKFSIFGGSAPSVSNPEDTSGVYQWSGTAYTIRAWDRDSSRVSEKAGLTTIRSWDDLPYTTDGSSGSGIQLRAWDNYLDSDGLPAGHAGNPSASAKAKGDGGKLGYQGLYLGGNSRSMKTKGGELEGNDTKFKAASGLTGGKGKIPGSPPSTKRGEQKVWNESR